MLFLLTGDVQIGKSRWLEALTAQLAAEGVPVAGVLAPGVWRERTPHEADGTRGLSGEGRFEKLGIDNVLLPGGERVAFARRRDLARAEGTYDEGSQSAAAQLAWHISDDALAQVNAHFDRLAARMRAASASGWPCAADPVAAGVAAPGALPVSAPEMFHVKHSFAQTNVSREISCARSGLLVVDELGRLELLRDGGLTSATALLDAGATPRFPHALVVVRDWLCDRACERFAAAWGGAEKLAPGDGARNRIRAAFGLAL